MMPLPYVLLAALLAIVGAGVGGYVAGRSDGRTLEAAEHRKVEDAIAAAKAELTSTVADSIAKIEVKNVTIRQKAETVVRENPVYRDCQLDARGLQLVNEALTGQGPGGRPGAGESGVPGPGAADRPVAGGDVPQAD